MASAIKWKIFDISTAHVQWDIFPCFQLGGFVRHASGNFSVTMETNQTCFTQGLITTNLNLEPQKPYRIVLFEDQKKLVSKQVSACVFFVTLSET